MDILGTLCNRYYSFGRLEITDVDGRTTVLEGKKPGPSSAMRIHDPSFRRKLLLNPQLALGEGYMNGLYSIEKGDLYDLVSLCMRNSHSIDSGAWYAVLAWFHRLGRSVMQYNPIGRAQRNVAHHYDLSDALYDLFLDADRQYSCAYYSADSQPLEEAQENKKRHIAAKLLIEPGMKVLDIGSGWGGLGIFLAQATDAQVVGVTLSEEQHKVSCRRAIDMGVVDWVDFRLLDYRLLEEEFDRIVSVGMFEHVGITHYPEFFEKARDLLKDEGVALLHTIGRADGPGYTNPWIRKYIFPGGYCPALSEITPPLERTGMYTTDIEVLRLHYAETLKAWRRRFLANKHKVEEIYDERFCRMWEFYLAGSEAAFRCGGHVVFQIQFARKQDTVPLTRDYIGEWESGLRDQARSAAE